MNTLNTTDPQFTQDLHKLTEYLFDAERVDYLRCLGERQLFDPDKDPADKVNTLALAEQDHIFGPLFRLKQTANTNPDHTDLLAALESANAIDIDGMFIRYFHLETDLEDEEGSNDILLTAQMVTEDYEKYEYYFTRQDLTQAVYHEDKRHWEVKYSQSAETFYLTLYSLAEL